MLEIRKFATLPWLLLSGSVLVSIGLELFYSVILAFIFLLHFPELLHSNLEGNSVALLAIFPFLFPLPLKRDSMNMRTNSSVHPLLSLITRNSSFFYPAFRRTYSTKISIVP